GRDEVARSIRADGTIHATPTRPRGGTGRRRALKRRFLCRFESCRGHQLASPSGPRHRAHIAAFRRFETLSQHHLLGRMIFSENRYPLFGIMLLHASLAQLEERRCDMAEAAGSGPAGRTITAPSSSG